MAIEFAFWHYPHEDTGGAQINGQFPLYDRGHIAEVPDAATRSRWAASSKASLILLFDPATPGPIGADVPNTIAATTLTANAGATFSGGDVAMNFGSGQELALDSDIPFALPLIFNNSNASPSSLGVEWRFGGTRRYADVLDATNGRRFVSYNSAGGFVGFPLQIALDAPTDALKIQSNGDVLVNARFLGINTTSPADRLHVDGGNLRVGAFVGDVSAGSLDGVLIDDAGSVNVSAGSSSALRLRRRTSDGFIAAFNRDTTTVGSISLTATATSYNTSSDERLKENFQAAGDALSLLRQIAVEAYDWKVNGEHTPFGYVAQRLDPYAPYAINKGDDPDDMWAVDHSKMVPVLHRGIQQIDARISDHEARLAALEAA